ncbi:MAG: tRNA (guanosine(37)-N1)-methyltransferase TrmD [Gammaproteobacteria bacterium RIFCSPLOWO2_02_FULL_61_13]|nr:MAG: tRNA (guanosine(37)-N1)-methyltransferase TrmD [Gammaproteobacteria bacterium RIFCSPLOWO2_02_FULL_61_13]
MLKVGVVTLFPEMFDLYSDWGVSGRAVDRGLVHLSLFNPRDHAEDAHRTVDDRPYGGGPGMVMMYRPLQRSIQDARMALPGAKVHLLTPQGQRLEQADVQALARMESLILVAGRYEGLDERLIDAEVDQQWSLGDYVLSGGELACLVLLDAMTRLLPGSLGDECSAGDDSFAHGLLEHPQYTRPEEVDGRRVPEILLSGNHGAIRRWRMKQALGRTWLRRPELLERQPLDAEQKLLLEEFIAEQGQSSV